MTTYGLLLLAHIVLFAYWLGGDIGVFHSSFRVCDASLTREARVTALRIMLWVDMIPRYCLVLSLPVGLSLATTLGWLPAVPGLLPGVWAFALAWLWMVWAIHHYQGKPLADALRRVDLGVRVAVIAALLTTGTMGLAGSGPVAQPWLAAKIVIFGVLVACGLMIRVMLEPFGPAFAQIMREGSSPDAEARLNASLGRARPFVVLIWVGLVVIAWLGAVKPAFG